MEERLFRFHYQTIVRFSNMIEGHNFKLRCRPMQTAFQEIKELEFYLYPKSAELHLAKDSFGNDIEYGCIAEPHVSFIYQCSGIADMSAYKIAESEVPFFYRCSSKLTFFTEDMNRLLPQETMEEAGIEKWVEDCAHNIYCTMHYQPGTTTNDTTASQALALEAGVCQDYAHLLIAICRKNGLAARYVSGFMMGIGETHAWVEVYDGEVWYAFDPTNDQQITFGYIKIAHGRDASDCPVNRGVFRGNANQQMEIEVRVEEI